MSVSEMPSDLNNYVDIDDCLSRIGGNILVYQKLLASYLENPIYPMLFKSLSEKEYTAAEQHAHTLKGVAGNLSLKDVYRLSCQLDELLKKNQTSPDLEANLRAAVTKTNEYIAWIKENL